MVGFQVPTVWNAYARPCSSHARCLGVESLPAQLIDLLTKWHQASSCVMETVVPTKLGLEPDKAVAFLWSAAMRCLLTGLTRTSTQWVQKDLN